jgi:hypothetical protein
MNCSQLLERRTITNWERPAQPVADTVEHRESSYADNGPWAAVRSYLGHAFAAWVTPTLKTSSN